MAELSFLATAKSYLGKQIEDAWRCCCALDGVIYFSPANGSGILTLDIETGELGIISTQEICDRKHKWEGCCVVGQKVYFTPCCAHCVLILDSTTRALSKVETDHICSREWAWALAGSVVGSRIYFCPNQALCILVLDTDTEEVSTVSTEHLYNGERGYWGCCAFDGKVYFAPSGASRFLVLDTNSNEVKFLGETTDLALSSGRCDRNGDSRFWGCLAIDGRIYYCPSSAPAICVFDVASETFSHIDTEAICKGQFKWWGVCQVSSDKVYFSPNQAQCILVLDIVTRTVSTIDCPSRQMRMIGCDWSWIGCCAVRGEFFASPGLTKHVLVESSHVPKLVLTLEARINPTDMDEADGCTCNISCTGANGEVVVELDHMPMKASTSDVFTAIRDALGVSKRRSPKLCLVDGSLLQDDDDARLIDLLDPSVPSPKFT